MVEIKDRLQPGENVQYQYSYSLVLKIIVAVMMPLVVWLLYSDLRSANYLWVLIEAVGGFYAAKWLVQALRDRGKYVVTDRRVMRLMEDPAADQVIRYTDISDVRLKKDTLSGSGFVVVEAKDQRVLRIPLPNLARQNTEGLLGIINGHRPASQEE